MQTFPKRAVSPNLLQTFSHQSRGNSNSRDILQKFPISWGENEMAHKPGRSWKRLGAMRTCHQKYWDESKQILLHPRVTLSSRTTGSAPPSEKRKAEQMVVKKMQRGQRHPLSRDGGFALLSDLNPSPVSIRLPFLFRFELVSFALELQITGDH